METFLEGAPEYLDTGGRIHTVWSDIGGEDPVPGIVRKLKLSCQTTRIRKLNTSWYVHTIRK